MGGRVGRREGRRGDRAGLVAVSFCGIYHHHDVSHRSSFRAVPSTEQQKQQKQQKQESRTRRRDYNNPKGRVPYPFTLFIGRAERDTAGGRWPVDGGRWPVCWLCAGFQLSGCCRWSRRGISTALPAHSACKFLRCSWIMELPGTWTVERVGPSGKRCISSRGILASYVV